MARVSFGGGVTEIYGKLGGSVFQRARGGGIIRTLSVPTNPNTPNQTLARGKITTLAFAWNTLLTDSERAAWNHSVPAKISGGKGNLKIIGQGRLYFNKINRIILEGGGTIRTTPPQPAALGPLVNPVLTVDSMAQTIVLSWDTPAIADPYVLSIWSTQPYSPANNYVANTQKFTVNYQPATSPLDFTADWIKRHGGWALESGCKVFAIPYIINLFNGDISPNVPIVGIAS